MTSNRRSTIKYVLLTGVPGIGKTTLVKKVHHLLCEKDIPVRGFFTEEVRQSGRRIGFDIESLDGTRGTLARLKESQEIGGKQYIVGQYSVTLKSFEEVALPVLKTEVSDGILVLDEIGKMELFSNAFKEEVNKAFANPNNVILATIPVPKGKPIPFIENIRQNRQARVVTVNHQNRSTLQQTVFDMLVEALQNK